MKRKEIIQALKGSITTPDFWSNEMWEVAKEIGRDKFEIRLDGYWRPFASTWAGGRVGYNSVYRLHPDYKDTKIEECIVEVEDRRGLLIFLFGGECVLPNAPMHKEWRGNKFSDGTESYEFRKEINGKIEWPTHVLMEIEK